MEFIQSIPLSDVLLACAAIAAGGYCLVLSKRLKNFNNLENGMGGAIAVLSAQIDDLTKMLAQAEKSAKLSAEQLLALTDRSESGAARLELLLASLHDLPEAAKETEQEPPARFMRSDTDHAILEAAE